MKLTFISRDPSTPVFHLIGTLRGTVTHGSDHPIPAVWYITCCRSPMPATVWKGYLSFGLVSFPIRLFAAARAEPVHFHMLHKPDQSRIEEVWYCAEENKRVEKSEIVKGYEYSKGKYVVVEQDELKKVAPATATAMEILQFREI
jgi:hypothetical protein